MGTVDRWGGYTVNLLHYEDAATLAEAVLSGAGLSSGGDAKSTSSSWRSKAFLGTDGAPITFQDMCDAAVASGVYKASAPVKFTAAAEEAGSSRGKLMSNAATREALGGAWKPKYSSFEAFVASGAVDVYGTDARLGGGVGAAHAG
jgi:nucleoside-diphosphate-sugar epimerase